MSNNFVQSNFLREAYFTAIKAHARCHVWRQGPKVFINSIPKSGTHLLTSLLDSTDELMSAGRHLKTTDFDLSSKKESFLLNTTKFESEVSRVRGMQYFSAHFPWDHSFKQIFEAHEVKALNMIRDPRDMIVSRYFYIMGLKRHPLHSFLANNFKNEEQRILALIKGPESESQQSPNSFIPYQSVLKRFIGWQQNTSALTIRYEDVIGPRGDTSEEHQIDTIMKLLSYLTIDVNEQEVKALIPKFLGIKTATMRTGRSGEWHSRLSTPAREAVVEHLDDMILEMDYS